MTINATIKEIKETNYFGKNNFAKREVVVETTEQYPQTLLIEFIQDRTDLIDPYTEGEEADFSINIRGNTWVNPQGETKYFTALQCWKIEKGRSSAPQQEQQQNTSQNQPLPEYNPEEQDDNEHDDLPF